MDALYSKSEGMVQSGYRALRALASVPGRCGAPAVLPPLVEQLAPALTGVDSSHRMMSVFGALAVMAGPLLARRHYPQGALQLETLLWSVLAAYCLVLVLMLSRACAGLRCLVWTRSTRSRRRPR